MRKKELGESNIEETGEHFMLFSAKGEDDGSRVEGILSCSPIALSAMLLTVLKQNPGVLSMVLARIFSEGSAKGDEAARGASSIMQ
jgi:hypothetical protein